MGKTNVSIMQAPVAIPMLCKESNTILFADNRSLVIVQIGYKDFYKKENYDKHSFYSVNRYCTPHYIESITVASMVT